MSSNSARSWFTRPAQSESKFANVDGLELHYLDFGESASRQAHAPGTDPRPKLLFVHGGAANAHWFDFVAGAFVDRYRVLSLDLRGHGDSEWTPEPAYSYEEYAGDVARFIEAQSLGKVVLVGHSMGGMVSIVVAATYPAKVQTLVVVDSLMQMSPERVSTLRDIGQGKGRAFETQEAYIAGFKIRPDGSTAAPQVVKHVASRACRQFDDGLWRNKFDRNVYARRHPIDSFDYWSRVRAKVLLVAGGNSDRITPAVLAQVRAACPQASLRTVADSGHHVTLDNPKGFGESVREYLGGP